MTGSACRVLDDVLDALAAGEAASAADQAHLDGCVTCQTRLALARRIDRALVAWPTPAPPRHFAATVSAVARQDAWRQEVVVDWGFNIALAASLALIATGAVAFVWVLGATAGTPVTSHVTAEAIATLLTRLRAQMPVVGTAAALLGATAAAWWWAEARERW